MESPEKRLLRLLVERDPARPEFISEFREALRPILRRAEFPGDKFDLWQDVFVQQNLPWGRFLQSALLHAAAVALIWTLSLSWIRQQKILVHAAFDPSSLVTYTPEEYLPPLDTGASEAPKEQTAQKGDPVYAKQPILSVPREADNRSQTIVVPPDLKLDRDVALPNIVAMGAVVPAVPLDATRAPLSRIVAPETQVVAPAPDVEFAPDRVLQAAMKSDVIAPPPEVTSHQTRGLAGPDSAVVEPPPELTQSTKGHVGLMNIGPSEVVAPAPQLTLAEQHSLMARGSGRSGRRQRATGGPSANRGRDERRQRGWTADRVGNPSRRALGPRGCSRRQSPGNICRNSTGKTGRFGNTRCGGIEIGSEECGRSRRRQRRLQRAQQQLSAGWPACGRGGRRRGRGTRDG